MFSTVLLPDPDGPSKATNSPLAMVKETSLTASSSVPPRRNDLPSPRTSIRVCPGSDLPGAGRGALAALSIRSGRIGLLRRLGKARIDDLRHGDRLDAGQLAEPDLGAPVEARLVDLAGIVDEALHLADVERGGVARGAAQV